MIWIQYEVNPYLYTSLSPPPVADTFGDLPSSHSHSFCLLGRANILSEGLSILDTRFPFPHSWPISHWSTLNVMGLFWRGHMVTGGGHSGRDFLLVERERCSKWILSFPYHLDAEKWHVLWPWQQSQSVKTNALKIGGRRILSLRTKLTLGLTTSKLLFWAIMPPVNYVIISPAAEITLTYVLSISRPFGYLLAWFGTQVQKV